MAEYMDQANRDVTFKEMLREIHPVWDWFTLGLYLGIPVCELKTIECQYSQLNMRKMEVLHSWFQKVDSPCWRTLGEALLFIPDHVSDGIRILDKHFPKPPKSGPAIPSHIRPCHEKFCPPLNFVLGLNITCKILSASAVFCPI